MDEPSHRAALRHDDLLAELDRFGAAVDKLNKAKIHADEVAREWEQKYRKSVEDLEQAQREFERRASEHWALRNDYNDKSRELEILQLKLQNSIPLADWRNPPPKLKTALEVAQGEQIEQLKKERQTLRDEIKRLEGSRTGG